MCVMAVTLEAARVAGPPRMVRKEWYLPLDLVSPARILKTQIGWQQLHQEFEVLRLLLIIPLNNFHDENV